MIVGVVVIGVIFVAGVVLSDINIGVFETDVIVGVVVFVVEFVVVVGVVFVVGVITSEVAAVEKAEEVALVRRQR